MLGIFPLLQETSIMLNQVSSHTQSQRLHIKGRKDLQNISID